MLSGGALLVFGRWICDAWPKGASDCQMPTITIMVHASVWRVPERRGIAVFVVGAAPFRRARSLHDSQTAQSLAGPLPDMIEPSAKLK